MFLNSLTKAKGILFSFIDVTHNLCMPASCRPLSTHPGTLHCVSDVWVEERCAERKKHRTQGLWIAVETLIALDWPNDN